MITKQQSTPRAGKVIGALKNKNIIKPVVEKLKMFKEVIDLGIAGNVPILQVEIQELIEEVCELPFAYETEYSSDTNKYHFHTYIQLGKQAKAKVIAGLEDLSGELSAKNINPNRCMKLIDRIIEADLYTKDVQKIINKWDVKQGAPKKYKLLIK